MTVRLGRSMVKEPKVINQELILFTCFVEPMFVKKMFCFIFDIGNKRYKNLLKHFENLGFCERKHGLSGKPSKRKSHVLSADSITRIVEYIKNVAEKFAVPLPGRMPNFKDYKLMKLPSSETKSAIYRRFVQVCFPED